MAYLKRDSDMTSRRAEVCAYCGKAIYPGQPRIEWWTHTGEIVYHCDKYSPHNCATDFMLRFARDIYDSQQDFKKDNRKEDKKIVIDLAQLSTFDK